MLLEPDAKDIDREQLLKNAKGLWHFWWAIHSMGSEVKVIDLPL
jgi:hypothetical protein